MGASGTARQRPAIVSAVSVVEEVDGLADQGADELFCGVTPMSWSERYGDASWLNRRAGGKSNLTSIPELEQVVRRAHARNVALSVTLNAPSYTAGQLPAVLTLCGQLGEVGVDRLIIGDPALMFALRDAGSTLPITVSSVAAVRNAAAAAFFCELGAARIILPRHLSIEAITELRRQVAVELEVFALNDGCVYEEGFCATTHAAGAFCMTPWDYEFTRLDAAPADEQDARVLEQNADDYREWIWYLANCGARLSHRRLPNGPCALCALWDLHAIGVDALKIVGREAHPLRKLRSVELVHAVLAMVKDGATRDETRAFARELRATPELCASGYMCYYRDCPRGAG